MINNPPPAGVAELQSLYALALRLVVPLAFVILVVVLFYAGIRFLTSGGDAKGIQGASQTMTWAILGILFLVVAWLVLQLIQAFTGVPVTTFCIGFKPYCP